MFFALRALVDCVALLSFYVAWRFVEWIKLCLVDWQALPKLWSLAGDTQGTASQELPALGVPCKARQGGWSPKLTVRFPKTPYPVAYKPRDRLHNAKSPFDIFEMAPDEDDDGLIIPYFDTTLAQLLAAMKHQEPACGSSPPPNQPPDSTAPSTLEWSTPVPLHTPSKMPVTDAMVHSGDVDLIPIRPRLLNRTEFRKELHILRQKSLPILKEVVDSDLPHGKHGALMDLDEFDGLRTPSPLSSLPTRPSSASSSLSELSLVPCGASVAASSTATSPLEDKAQDFSWSLETLFGCGEEQGQHVQLDRERALPFNVLDRVHAEASSHVPRTKYFCRKPAAMGRQASPRRISKGATRHTRKARASGVIQRNAIRAGLVVAAPLVAIPALAVVAYAGAVSVIP